MLSRCLILVARFASQTSVNISFAESLGSGIGQIASALLTQNALLQHSRCGSKKQDLQFHAEVKFYNLFGFDGSVDPFVTGCMSVRERRKFRDRGVSSWKNAERRNLPQFRGVSKSTPRCRRARLRPQRLTTGDAKSSNTELKYLFRNDGELPVAILAPRPQSHPLYEPKVKGNSPDFLNCLPCLPRCIPTHRRSRNGRNCELE